MKNIVILSLLLFADAAFAQQQFCSVLSPSAQARFQTMGISFPQAITEYMTAIQLTGAEDRARECEFPPAETIRELDTGIAWRVLKFAKARGPQSTRMLVEYAASGGGQTLNGTVAVKWLKHNDLVAKFDAWDAADVAQNFQTRANVVPEVGHKSPVPANRENAQVGAQIASAPITVDGGSSHLLWDYTREDRAPEIAADVKEQLREVIGPIAHNENDLTFGPAITGTFYAGQNPNSQTAYSVGLSWLKVEGRGHAQGDLCFIVIATADHFDPYEASGGCKLLRAFRPANASADMILSESSGMAQGVTSNALRVWSAADHSLKLVADLGISRIDDCDGMFPKGIVGDRVSYRSDEHGSITILPKAHFLRTCGSRRPFVQLGTDADSAQKALFRLKFPSPPR